MLETADRPDLPPEQESQPAIDVDAWCSRQRIGRIYRLGRHCPIDVYNLVGELGIESRIADLVGSKQALFTGLFDRTTDEVAFARAGSFLSRIERIVTPALEPADERAHVATLRRATLDCLS